MVPAPFLGFKSAPCAKTAPKSMYTEPKIISTNELSVRAYVTFYFNGQRVREYNGRKLGLHINPNRASSKSERDKLLKKLLFEFQKALENGWNPIDVEVVEQVKPAHILLNEALEEKLNSSLSWSYKRDLEGLCKKLLEFLSETEKKHPISNITSQRLNSFLSQFATSGTHYMNKRTLLGALFSLLVSKGYLLINPVEKTLKKKSKATLHKVYTPEQVKSILDLLKSTYPNLHLCCLLTYGCLLRPHEETRLLKRKHFNTDLTQITLSGNENKSGRVRTVHVPDYVREVLLEHSIHFLKPNENIFSKSESSFNVSYFSLQWSRAKVVLKNNGLLEDQQTIYSFRHSAAINIYKRTKDIHILQQLLGHSNMIVTLKYLRGLGELNAEEHREYMPVL
jgi:integrase